MSLGDSLDDVIQASDTLSISSFSSQIIGVTLEVTDLNLYSHQLPKRPIRRTLKSNSCTYPLPKE